MSDKDVQSGPSEEVPCSAHPDAPHGFNRNASHTEDRYVCDCEGWNPPAGARDAVADDEKFADWLAREMPPGTTISNPYWWAPRIIRALEALAGKADGGES